MLYNDKATFYRPSSTIVDQWVNGTSCIPGIPKSSAFLSVEVEISDSGDLVLDGLNAAGATVSETLSFTESGIRLSENEFKSILTLTPSWLTYNITIKAEDKQGQPIQSLTTYGPFLISSSNITSDRLRDNVNISGWEKSQWLQAYIESFQPLTNDQVITSRGFSGWVQDCVPVMQPNLSKGWQFFIVIDKNK